MRVDDRGIDWVARGLARPLCTARLLLLPMPLPLELLLPAAAAIAADTVVADAGCRCRHLLPLPMPLLPRHVPSFGTAPGPSLHGRRPDSATHKQGRPRVCQGGALRIRSHLPEGRVVDDREGCSYPPYPKMGLLFLP